MRHVLATVGKIALGCFAVLAFAGLTIVGAYLGLGLSGGPLRLPVTTPEETVSSPSATPAEIVATRFPTEEEVLEPAPAPAPTFSTASVIPGEHEEPFDLNAVSGMTAVEPPWPAIEGAAPAAGNPEEPERQSEPAKPDTAKGSHRETARSLNVLNDAMIASIRRRLNLTSEQQKLWPAVESALRKIVYTRAAMSPQGRGGQPSGPYIDLASAEVRELKSAALPLLIRLNSEQKSEVKKRAYIMGLEAVASQF
jgi:hypothetical protein